MRRILHYPVYIILLQKGWQALSGLVTAVLVTIYLSADEQGYYYTFASLLSGYVLLDLGLSALLIQLSARLFPGLKIENNGRIEPESDRRRAFVSMVVWSRRWFRYVGLATISLFPIGYIYFSSAGDRGVDIPWVFPWLVIVLSVALSIQAYPSLSIVEGTGRVAETYLIRLAHYVLGAVAAWIMLIYGFGLYALAMAPASVAVITFIWKKIRYKALFTYATVEEEGFNWKQEVWPLQRKVAISWFANYLFLYSPTLIVFYYGSPATAGQLGLSIIIANLIASLSSSRLTAKVPTITHLISKGESEESTKIFRKEFVFAFFVAISAYSFCIVALSHINLLNISSRVLNSTQLMLLFASFMVFFSFSMFVIYFRAQGREVMAPVAFISALLAMVISLFSVTSFGVTGVLITYLVIYGGVCSAGMIYWWVKK